ncbi:MAG: polysaccharide biosynthesis/export family protein [Deltaproteobacteria bacterium]|nr:polysaccharide biosynthesis/export family protein [Deltaproteobacteria bacterium]
MRESQGFKGVLAAALFLFGLGILIPQPSTASDKTLKKDAAVKNAAAEKIVQKTSTAQEATADKPATKTAAVAQDPEYLIGIEDVLEISVWRNAELSKTVVVRPDGMISLPLVGDMKAAGLTPSQLRDSIIESLKEYQETVVASVIVQEVKSYRIYVLGEVINPGSYTVMRKTTLLQAIALAGGFNPFASKNKLILIREKLDKSAKPERISVRFDDIIDTDSKTDRNLVLKPGDTIFVP